MLLFKPAHVDPVCEGRKVETRRAWRFMRAKHGTEHKCYTRPPWGRGGAEPFAIIRVTAPPYRQQLGAVNLADAIAEGYASIGAFRDVWCAIHGRWNPELGVVVVRFELVADLRRAWREHG